MARSNFALIKKITNLYMQYVVKIPYIEKKLKKIALMAN